MDGLTNVTHLLPPDLANTGRFKVRIPMSPNHPTDRETVIQEWDIDLGWLLFINDDIKEEQLQVITAWYASLVYWLSITEYVCKVVAGEKLRNLQLTETTPKGELKEYKLRQDHDYTKWKKQAYWLKAMTEALVRLIPLLQTHHANARPDKVYGGR